MLPPVQPGSFWLVGCGNMGGAMLHGWLEKGADPSAFTVIRPSGRQVAPGVRVLRELPTDAAPSVVMLGIKPQKLADVAPHLSPLVEPRTLLISIMAGVELSSLRERFAAPRGLVRAMPNRPVSLGKGVIGLAGSDMDAQQRDFVSAWMGALGLAEWLEDEGQMDVFTALAASGPAFLYRFIDSLADAGAALGLSLEQSRLLSLATVDGAAAMAAQSDEDPATLAERVASPGGSTRAGLDVLDRGDHGLRPLIMATLEAATLRNRELAEEARRP